MDGGLCTKHKVTVAIKLTTPTKVTRENIREMEGTRSQLHIYTYIQVCGKLPLIIWCPSLFVYVMASDYTAKNQCLFLQRPHTSWVWQKITSICTEHDGASLQELQFQPEGEDLSCLPSKR